MSFWVNGKFIPPGDNYVAERYMAQQSDLEILGIATLMSAQLKATEKSTISNPEITFVCYSCGEDIKDNTRFCQDCYEYKQK